MDDNGNELAYHVLQSIDRLEYPAGCVKGVKRERTTTCYLYRRHPNNRVQCFLWGKVYDIGSVARRQRLAEYVVAGAWLNVVRSVDSAEAKKCTKLVVSAEARSWPSKYVTCCSIARHCALRMGIKLIDLVFLLVAWNRSAPAISATRVLGTSRVTTRAPGAAR